MRALIAEARSIGLRWRNALTDTFRLAEPYSLIFDKSTNIPAIGCRGKHAAIGRSVARDIGPAHPEDACFGANAWAWGVARRIQLLSKNVLQIRQGSFYPALYRLEHKR